MKLMIDPRFMERVVFERSRMESHVEAHYGREFAACFDAGDSAAREQAFSSLHQKWFESFGFRAMLLTALAEFPWMERLVACCIVDGAPRPQLQDAELRGCTGNFTLLLRLHSQTLLDAPGFQQYARHELMHIEDILDPAFQYSRDLGPSAWNPASRNLHRERYALLWAMSIDERLHRRHGPRHPRSCSRGREIMKAFNLDSLEQAETFTTRIRDNGLLNQPTHRALLEWTARGGSPNATELESAEPALNRPLPGRPCPLCRFPTFDWMTDVAQPVVAAIKADFPGWLTAQGACGRCVELYRGRAAAGRGAGRITSVAVMDAGTSQTANDSPLQSHAAISHQLFHNDQVCRNNY